MVTKRKLWSPPSGSQLTIVNPELLSDGWGMPEGCQVIFDEAHAFKSPRAKRTKVARAMARAAIKGGGSVWLLTGTPMLNRPIELWNVLSLANLHEQAFGGWKRFTTLFNAKKNRWGGWVFGDAKPEVAECLANVALGRKRADVLPDLPTKRHEVVDVDIAPRLKAALDNLGVDAEALLENPLAFETLAQVRSAIAAAKIPTLLELVARHEEEAEPLVVFGAHKTAIKLLGERPGWTTITGDVPTTKRTEMVDAFQAGQLKGIALTIRAGGVGLTLTRACRAVFVDREWTPSLNVQAEDRVCRIGQTRGVIITDLVADHPLEQRVYEVLRQKEALIRSAFSPYSEEPK